METDQGDIPVYVNLNTVLGSVYTAGNNAIDVSSDYKISLKLSTSSPSGLNMVADGLTQAYSPTAADLPASGPGSPGSSAAVSRGDHTHGVAALLSTLLDEHGRLKVDIMPENWNPGGGGLESYEAHSYELQLDFIDEQDVVWTAIPDGVSEAWAEGAQGLASIELALPDDSLSISISSDPNDPTDISAFAGSVVKAIPADWDSEGTAAAKLVLAAGGSVLPAGQYKASVSFKEAGDESWFVMPEGLRSISVFESFGGGTLRLRLADDGDPITVSTDPDNPTTAAIFAGQPVIFDVTGIDPEEDQRAAFGITLSGAYPKSKDWVICLSTPSDVAARTFPDEYAYMRLVGSWAGGSAIPLNAKAQDGDERTIGPQPKVFPEFAGASVDFYVKTRPATAAVYGVRVYE